MRSAHVLAIGVLLSAFVVVGCNSDTEGRAAVADGETGTLRAACVAPPSFEDFCPDIEGLRVEVYDADGVLVEQADTHLKEQTFPTDLFSDLASADGTPLDELGDGHRFGDTYFVLMPGIYTVKAVALDAGGEVYEGCKSAETEVVVHAGATAETFLIIQCDCATGGVDVVVVINVPPVIWKLTYDPNKFICCYEDVHVTVEAEDPEGDAITWQWELVTPEPLPEHVWWEAVDGEMSFHGPVGNYEFRVTVTDVAGASASLLFPVHVMDERSGCDECVAPPDCIAAEAWSWDCSSATWTQNVLCVDGDLTLDQAFDCAGGSRMWVPSTDNDHMVLFELPSGRVVGDYPLPGEDCGPAHVARDANGNIYATCSRSGMVYRLNQDGVLLRSFDLGQAPYGCTGLGGAAYFTATDTLYVGCATRGDEPGMVVGLDGFSLAPTGANGGVVIDEADGLTAALHVSGLATDGAYIYASATDDEQILAIDPERDAIQWSFAARPYGIAVQDGWLWYTVDGFAEYEGQRGGHVCRVRTGYYGPSAADCLAYDLPSAHVSGESAVLGSGVAINPLDGHIWAAVSDANAVIEIEPWGMEIVAVHHTAVTDPVGIAFDEEANAYVVHRGYALGSDPAPTGNDGVVLLARDPVLGTYGSPVLFGRSVLENPDAYASDMTGSAQCFPLPGYWKRIYAMGCPGECKQVVVAWDSDAYVEVKTLIDGVWDVPLNGVPFQTMGDEMEVRLRLDADPSGAVPTLFDLDVSYESPCP